MLRVSSKLTKSLGRHQWQSLLQFSSKASKSATSEEKIPEPLTNPSILYTGVSRNRYSFDHFFLCEYIHFLRA